MLRRHRENDLWVWLANQTSQIRTSSGALCLNSQNNTVRIAPGEQCQRWCSGLYKLFFANTHIDTHTDTNTHPQKNTHELHWAWGIAQKIKPLSYKLEIAIIHTQDTPLSCSWITGLLNTYLHLSEFLACLSACPQENINRRTETRNRAILELEHRRNGTDKFI